MKETHKLKGKKTDKNGKQIPTTHHREFLLKLPALYQTQVSFDVQWEFLKVDWNSFRKLKNDLRKFV